jgi:hypothetical protein
MKAVSKTGAHLLSKEKYREPEIPGENRVLNSRLLVSILRIGGRMSFHY